MSQPAARPRFTWPLRTRSLNLGERTLIMAILNLTPDSFSGDGLLAHHITRAAVTKLAMALAVEAQDNGADILDLGAESTRSNATPLDLDEEQDRLLPVLEGLLAARPQAIVSVDTYHPRGRPRRHPDHQRRQWPHQPTRAAPPSSQEPTFSAFTMCSSAAKRPQWPMRCSHTQSSCPPHPSPSWSE